MAQQPRRRILGICLDEYALRLAEVEKILGRYKVLNVTEIHSNPSFSLKTLQDPESLAQLENHLHNVVAERGFAAEEIRIAVNAQYALIKRVPYEQSLSHKELQEHVAWELRQYIVSPLENYGFDFQQFPKPASGNHPTMLFVAIRTLVTEALESLVESLDIPLQVVTIDLLAMANADKYNYKFAPEEKITVIEIGDRYLTFILIEGDRFLGYHTIPLREINGGESIQDTDPNTIMTYISKQLRFLISDYWNDTDQTAFDHVLISRNSSQIPLDDIVSSSQQEEFKIVQPFRNVALAESLQHAVDAGTIMAEYLGAIGVTLSEE